MQKDTFVEISWVLQSQNIPEGTRKASKTTFPQLETTKPILLHRKPLKNRKIEEVFGISKQF